ncbi:MAG: mechanosensitive ion channel [Planctomycetes bacterium]|nr:mechanosensitive ion channel [Planctomycetota bacterium]
MGNLWAHIRDGTAGAGTAMVLGLAAFVAAACVSLLLLRPLAEALCRGESDKVRGGRVRRIRFSLLVASLAFGLFVLLHATIPAGTRLGRPSYQFVQLFLVLFAFYALFEMALTFVADFLPRLRGNAPVTPFAKDIVRTVVFVVVFMYAIRQSFPTADFGAVLTTSAILSVVVGLALQESLSNVFAGLLLSVDRPFQPGEWIEIDGREGKVVDSNWRSTRICTRDDDVIYVPNNVLSKSTVMNFSRPTKEHWCVKDVGIEYGAPPNKVRAVLINMMRQIDGILHEPVPEVRVVGYGDSAITYRLMWVIENYDRRTAIEAEVLRAVWYHLKRNGISIPFPIRDVYLRRVKPEKGPDEMVALLKEVDILKPLDPKELEMLAEDLTSQLFARGEVIFRQGEPGSTFHIVKSGVIAVIIKGVDGVEAEVAQLKAGQYFGEMSLLTGDARSSTCKALEDTELLCLDRDSFAVLLRENPPIAQAISEIISARQTEAREKLEIERETVVRRRPKEEGQTKRILEKIWTIFGFKRNPE